VEGTEKKGTVVKLTEAAGNKRSTKRGGGKRGSGKKLIEKERK